MLTLPFILRAYCILALLLLVAYAILIGRQASDMRAQVGQMSEELSELVIRENKAADIYTALEAKQRRERKSYTGEQAVLASSAVMDAKGVYEELNTRLQELQQQQLTLETSASALQLRMVPVVAIALLHIFGFFMIRIERPDGSD